MESTFELPADITLDSLKGIIDSSQLLQQTKADLPPTQAVQAAPEYSAPSNPTGATIVATDPVLASPAPPPVTRQGPSVPPPPTMGPLQGQPAPAVETNSRCLFFTGRSGVGKDWLAQKAGAKILSVSATLLDIAAGQFPGVQAKDLGGFLNTIFAWGEGTISKEYPITPTRFLFAQQMRQAWANYGTPGFWVGLIVEAAKQETGLVAVTGVSTPTAMKLLTAAGFKHWHVMTSPQTFATRAKRPGADDKLAAHFDSQAIQQNSTQKDGPRMPVIWNDTTPPPSGRLWTVDLWLTEVSGAPAESAMTFE